jgi:hypothetical protein
MSNKIIFIILTIFVSFSIALAGPTLPNEIDSEFTQYPGSTVIHTIESGGMVQAILFCENSSIENVFDYYKKKASQAGWDVTMEVKNPDTYQLMIEKNGRDGMIAVADENGEISVVLSISE